MPLMSSMSGKSHELWRNSCVDSYILVIVRWPYIAFPTLDQVFASNEVRISFNLSEDF